MDASLHLEPRATPSAPAATYALYRDARYFAGLDLLRAVSILAVIWHHTMADAFSAPITRMGHHGVTLFFAISGFLIVTLILREKARTGTFSIRAFYIRRTLRIFPLYYLTLALYLGLVVLLEPDPASRAQFFANLVHFATFTTNWALEPDGRRVIFYFAWSLAAEEQFYLVWPWLERTTTGRVPLIFGLGMVALSPDFFGALGGDAGAAGPLYALSRFPAAIGLGVVLAHVLHDPRLFGAASRLLGQRGSALAVATVLAVALSSNGALGLAEPAVIDLLAAALVASLVIRPDHDFAWLSGIRPLVHIGVVSYGLYLTHMIAVHIVKKLYGVLGLHSRLALFAGAVLAGTLIASLSYRTFERYFLDLKGRLGANT